MIIESLLKSLIRKYDINEEEALSIILSQPEWAATLIISANIILKSLGYEK